MTSAENKHGFSLLYEFKQKMSGQPRAVCVHSVQKKTQEHDRALNAPCDKTNTPDGIYTLAAAKKYCKVFMNLQNNLMY